jgi:uncharacterized protein with GYD domain
MAKRTKTAIKTDRREPIAIYLINFTDKGRKLSPMAIAEDQKRVTLAVKSAGGTCELFNTMGSPYDNVSVVRGISEVHAVINLATTIQATGIVTATLISGFNMFK